MQLYLVRPARSEKPAGWSGPGGLRPLTELGHAQANGLVELLGHVEVDAIACGPALRCRETLGPIAAALGKSIHIDDRLDRDADLADVVARVQELGERGAIVCLHRSGLLEALRSISGASVADLETRCERGAAWMIEGEPSQALYFGPRVRPAPTSNETIALERIQLRRPRRKRQPRSRIAVLDLGSTSFHMLVAESTPDGGIRRITRERAMLRMGAELARSGGKLSKSAIANSIDTVRDLCSHAEVHKAEELIAVATAALRDAANGSRVISKLEDAIGGPIRVLTGLEEARIIFEAIRARIDLHGQPHVGLDLGGGSLELVVGNDEQILFEATLPLGVARMHGEIDPSDPHGEDDHRQLHHRLRERLGPIVEEVRSHQPVGCIAVGGTARALARLILRGSGRDRSEIRGLRVERRTLAALGRELAALSHEERLERPGVSSRRADLLPFGADILTGALSLLGMEELTVCDWGLREGVILETTQIPAD